MSRSSLGAVLLVSAWSLGSRFVLLMCSVTGDNVWNSSGHFFKVSTELSFFGRRPSRGKAGGRGSLVVSSYHVGRSAEWA